MEIINIDEWLKVFVKKILDNFDNQINFIGIQGSYARKEANSESDIDFVVIFNKFNIENLMKYKQIIDDMPYREKICGFVGGKDELLNWERSDLFQFYYDTIPLFNDIDYLLPLIQEEDIKRAILIGACNIYHMCCHNILHENDINILKSIYKSARFILQAKYFLETGIYVKSKLDLIKVLDNEDCKILKELNFESFSLLSNNIIDFSSKIIKNYKS